jgi:hypothetical protein
MKMLKCKQRGMFDIRVIDPYIVNEITLQCHPKDVDNNLYTFFYRAKSQKWNSISLKLQVSVPILYTFFFAYSMLNLIDELCM